MSKQSDIENLIKWWNADVCGSEIAVRLGWTRGAVMGKVHRLRQKGMLGYRNDQPLKETAVVPPAPRRLPRAVGMTPQAGYKLKLREEKPMPVPVVPPPVPEYDPNHTYVKITQLTNKHCRYIMTDDTSSDALYCGDPVHYRLYCEAHTHLSYLSTSKKKAKPQCNSATHSRRSNFSRTAPIDITTSA